MADFYGVMQFQYQVLDVKNVEEAEKVINESLDQLGGIALDLDWEDVEWSIRQGEESNGA